jgi:hypothetical protein
MKWRSAVSLFHTNRNLLSRTRAEAALRKRHRRLVVVFRRLWIELVDRADYVLTLALLTVLDSLWPLPEMDRTIVTQ